MAGREMWRCEKFARARHRDEARSLTVANMTGYAPVGEGGLDVRERTSQDSDVQWVGHKHI